MFVLTSPSPLERGEQDLPTPLPLVFSILCCHFQLPPLVQSYSSALFCACCNNTRRIKSTITITFTSRGEQDLPTPLGSCCLFVCVDVMCLPLLQLPPWHSLTPLFVFYIRVVGMWGGVHLWRWARPTHRPLVLMFVHLCCYVMSTITIAPSLVWYCSPPCLICASCKSAKKSVSTITIILKVSKTYPPPLRLVVGVFVLPQWCVRHCYNSPYGAVLFPLYCLLCASCVNAWRASNV